MAQQTINVGAAGNDGTGDALRTAGQKINANFTELYAVTVALGTAATKNTGTSAGNVPVLDGSGLLDPAVLPLLAITDTFVVASQAAMLALTAQKGDVAVRSDLNKSFILSTNSPSTLADWKELLTPTDAVLSVAALTGAISAAALKTALSLNNVENTSDTIKSDFAGMKNGTLAVSASAGALTVAVKTAAGANPSAGDPVIFYFRNSTLTAGDFVAISVTAALSVVLGSTKTLGASNATGLRVWITAHNNAGTVQLGAINCSDATGVFCPQEYVKYTTAVPGNSSKTFYSTSAIGTAAPWRLIGFCEWNSLTTAGTWVAPDVVELFGPGVKKPGDVIQTVYATGGATTTTNTAFQPTAAQAPITLSSAANLVKVSAAGALRSDIIANPCVAALFRDTTEIGAEQQFYPSANTIGVVPSAFVALDKPNTLSVVTYQVKVKAPSANSVVYGSAPGGNLQAVIAEEIMG